MGPQTAKFFRFDAGKGRFFVAGHTFSLPRSRIARIAIGVLLVIGGCLSFLPILGIWMLPLGFLILSQDLPFVRRLRRRIAVRWARWRGKGEAR